MNASTTPTVVMVLGVICVVSLLGVLAFAAYDRDPPEILVYIASNSLGAISGWIATRRRNPDKTRDEGG